MKYPPPAVIGFFPPSDVNDVLYRLSYATTRLMFRPQGTPGLKDKKEGQPAGCPSCVRRNGRSHDAAAPGLMVLSKR